MIMSSMSSSISTKISKSIHLFSVVRKGFQASFRGTHCTTKTVVVAIHQIRQIVKTMSFARLIFLVVKIDAYKASIEAFASVMHHTKRSSPP